MDIKELHVKFKHTNLRHSVSHRSGQCYGCGSATVEQCITLLRAMATNYHMRTILCGQVRIIRSAY